MKPFSPTPELLKTAERVVWFQEPDKTLSEPIRFLAYAMRYGTAEDIVALERAGIGPDQYREVLDNAPAGVFDMRSWTFWNRKCDRKIIPPLPVRKLNLG